MNKNLSRRLAAVAVGGAALALLVGIGAPANATTLPVTEPTSTDVEGPADFTGSGTEVTGQFPETGPSDVVAPSTGGLQSIKLGPCTLYPSVTHTRKSGNWNTIGSKPYTKCTTAVTSIRQETTVYRVIVYGVNAKYAMYPGGNRGVASYEQKNIDPHCKNTKNTTWFTVTNGTVVYAGKTYYAQVVSPKNTWACGV